jgi:hypothetical protein
VTVRSPRRSRLAFSLGVVLMAASFLVYPAYPLLLVLAPGSERTRLGASIAASVLSWSAFAGGLYLAGKRGWVWLRRQWAGRRGPRRPPAAPPPGAAC